MHVKYEKKNSVLLKIVSDYSLQGPYFFGLSFNLKGHCVAIFRVEKLASFTRSTWEVTFCLILDCKNCNPGYRKNCEAESRCIVVRPYVTSKYFFYILNFKISGLFYILVSSAGVLLYIFSFPVGMNFMHFIYTIWTFPNHDYEDLQSILTVRDEFDKTDFYTDLVSFSQHRQRKREYLFFKTWI